jgi:hypothetical protein
LEAFKKLPTLETSIKVFLINAAQSCLHFQFTLLTYLQRQLKHRSPVSSHGLIPYMPVSEDEMALTIEAEFHVICADNVLD